VRGNDVGAHAQKIFRLTNWHIVGRGNGSTGIYHFGNSAGTGSIGNYKTSKNEMTIRQSAGARGVFSTAIGAAANASMASGVPVGLSARTADWSQTS
jgi:hypothetical protein